MLYMVEVSKTLTTEMEHIEADSEEKAIDKAIKMIEEEPAWLTGATTDWDARVFPER